MIFVFLIIVLFLGIALGNWYLNEKAPEEQVQAVLIKKKKRTSMDANNVMYDDYFLTFEINGATKKFKVRRNIYNQYNENTKGTLTFKRNRFVDFISK